MGDTIRDFFFALYVFLLTLILPGSEIAYRAPSSSSSIQQGHTPHNKGDGKPHYGKLRPAGTNSASLIFLNFFAVAT